MTSLPPSSPSGSSSPDDDSRALDLYAIAVDEYRFQVDLNWRRSQYFLAFCSALLVAGVGLQDRSTAAGIFAVGLLSSVLCFLSHQTQHGYYRAARDRMTALAKEAGWRLPPVETTPGAGSGRRRRVSVTRLTSWVLLLLGLLHLVGLVMALPR